MHPTVCVLVSRQAYTGIAAAAREHGLYPAVSMYNESDSMTMLGPKKGHHELKYQTSDDAGRTVRPQCCSSLGCERAAPGYLVLVLSLPRIPFPFLVLCSNTRAAGSMACSRAGALSR